MARPKKELVDDTNEEIAEVSEFIENEESPEVNSDFVKEKISSEEYERRVKLADYHADYINPSLDFFEVV